MILGMPRGFAVELAEVTDILEGHRRVPESFVRGIDRLGAGEMEHRPEQRRGVAVREHEPIAVGPDRVLRIEAHNAIPERVHQRRERHRRAGVPGLRLLDRIHREGANGVDRYLNHFLVYHHFLQLISGYGLVRCRLLLPSQWTRNASEPASVNASRNTSGSAIIRWISSGKRVTRRSDSTIGTPSAMFGTKWPSMTSMWRRSAPACSASATCWPRRAKSAERMEGASCTLPLSIS